MTDEDAVRRAIAEGVDRYGRIDVLFSNAGISGEVAGITDYPSDVFARVLAVHVLGAFHVLKHGIPHLSDGGSIVITSSVVGVMGFEGISGYVAAKHAQVGLMRAAAKELASRRIRVNSLHPGPTSTPFQDDIEMRATGKSQAEAAEIFDSIIPLGRHTTPEEIARAALYLASDDSSHMTSHTFVIDGGSAAEIACRDASCRARNRAVLIRTRRVVSGAGHLKATDDHGVGLCRRVSLTDDRLICG